MAFVLRDEFSRRRSNRLMPLFPPFIPSKEAGKSFDSTPFETLTLTLTIMCRAEESKRLTMTAKAFDYFLPDFLSPLPQQKGQKSILCFNCEAFFCAFNVKLLTGGMIRVDALCPMALDWELIHTLLGRAWPCEALTSTASATSSFIKWTQLGASARGVSERATTNGWLAGDGGNARSRSLKRAPTA